VGEALAKGRTERVFPFYLDVTDEKSIRDAADHIALQVGEIGLAGLINNAGIAVGCPLEVIPIEQLRRQFEVNVFGLIAVTQSLLPLLRRGQGRIINMGSIAGRATIPVMGPYSASKFALEALTDALRLELRQWGIHVSVIEPGAIATPIWEKSLKASTELRAIVPSADITRYAELMLRIKEAVGKAAERAIPPEAVVKAVVHALTAARPRTRYLVGTDAKIRAWMMKWLPDRLNDRLLSWILNLPSRQDQDSTD
jgi:NAD(P)-dependent dehydrogenase (short-subunit alcohol dehydrogenase family)